VYAGGGRPHDTSLSQQSVINGQNMSEYDSDSGYNMLDPEQPEKLQQPTSSPLNALDGILRLPMESGELPHLDSTAAGVLDRAQEVRLRDYIWTRVLPPARTHPYMIAGELTVYFCFKLAFYAGCD
jgi:hypothetical protein